ncbi:VOC family protein [Roseomonas frigidaquae]|uniref:VOC family protein n=1 Tax=Falsiroseomonas frigidaquae TaxID=487318 RepID=A0ABX1F0P5_9PROT|nr:VOC family protein [Falsiroseomonas frigidaquae]NKE45917.1 VOC family protein [Falsiroseomonas frigidaquae]
MAEIDHIVIGARTLEEGADYIEAQLGVRPTQGGAHPGIGTHNMLLSLGPQSYLEVIAADPDQPQPTQARPFDLDDPAVAMMLEAGPHLLAWVARTPVLDAVVTRLGTSQAGEVKAWSRGDLTWRMAFPPQRQDMRNLIPPLIQWDDGKGAAPRLKKSGCKLVALEAEHPDAEQLREALRQRGLDEALKVRRSPHPRLVARITRPDGSEVALSSG